jgi:uncharacterized membrane protein HdeD (DUF308 family)
LLRDSRPDAAAASRTVWHSHQPFALAAAFHAWKRRHIWPLLCYGFTYGALYSVAGADRYNSWESLGPWLSAVGRCALLAIPISLGIDILIVAACWVFVLLRFRVRSVLARFGHLVIR